VTRGVVDRHFACGEPELLAAAHAWRCILRQAAAYLSGLTDAPSDHATRSALLDAVDHVNHACARLTRVQAAIDNDDRGA
jgi:hypothetical protein